MGAAYYIVLHDPGIATFVNGKFIAQESERLDRIAQSVGLRMLGEYVSVNPVEAREEIAALGGDPHEVGLPDENWYEAEEGVEWVSKVIAYIESNTGSTGNDAGVLSDLKEYQVVFNQARAIGAKWHLGVDF